MGKAGLLKWERMGDYEKEKGYASYKTIVENFVGDIVLCNNIKDIDSTMIFDIKEDIFQYYLCNVSEYKKEFAENCWLKFSYSNLLDCDVLLVDHYGTSWDYVLTDCKLFEDYEELERYENE